MLKNPISHVIDFGKNGVKTKGFKVIKNTHFVTTNIHFITLQISYLETNIFYDKVLLFQVS